MNYHIIAKGESLWSIAQTHGCSLAELLAANPQITNPNNISLGEKIFLPEGCQTAEPKRFAKQHAQPAQSANHPGPTGSWRKRYDGGAADRVLH